MTKPDPYTHKKLIEYVMSMLAQGWDAEVIKRELKWAGHSPKMIDAVLQEVLTSYGKDVHAPVAAIEAAKAEEKPEEYREERPATEAKEKPFSTWASLFLMRSTSVEKTFSAIYFILIFILIVWTGVSTESPVANVFAGFLPVILTVLTVFALHDYLDEQQRWLVFAVPLAWCALFLAAATYAAIPLLAVLDVQNVLLLNVVLGMAFSGLVYFLGGIERSLVEQERMKVMKKKVISEMTGEEKRARHGTALSELDVLFSDLEEGVKRLNTAIGKVYAERHGGSPAVRDAVRIPPEWFQEYRQASPEHADARLKAAKKAVTRVYERLMDMRRPEKDVFGPAAMEFQHLNRDRQGRSKVIDVLVANDQEPVHDSYQRSLEACSKAIESLKRTGLLPQK